nr:hypothetical protein GCM10020063_104290 [Dactylosporangium thailandense]
MIVIAQAGGIDEIPKELLRLAKPYLDARPDESLPLRVLAIADSDAKTPGHLSGSAREVVKTARELGATSLILQKRSIENYVPDDSLYVFAMKRRDRMPVVRQILSLSKIARDHYPMKTGLSSAEHIAAKIYPPEFPLQIGMGDFIFDLLDNFGYQVTATGLMNRDGEGELVALLAEMEKNL